MVWSAGHNILVDTQHGKWYLDICVCVIVCALCLIYLFGGPEMLSTIRCVSRFYPILALPCSRFRSI